MAGRILHTHVHLPKNSSNITVHDKPWGRGLHSALSGQSMGVLIFAQRKEQKSTRDMTACFAVLQHSLLKSS
jgi:hypothetical protein